GEELEKTVLDTVQSALASTGSTTLEQALAGEQKVRSAHLDQLMQGRGGVSPLHYSTNQTFITVTDAFGATRKMQVDPAYLAERQSRAEEAQKTMQQGILQLA